MARQGWQGETGEYSETLRCAQCGRRWQRPVQGGRRPRYCSDACKQQAYRARQAEERERYAGAGRGSGGASGTRSGSTGGAYDGYGAGYEEQGSSSYSSWSSGYGSGSSHSSAGAGQRSQYHARHMSAQEARATIFRIAQVRDDGVTSVKKAYRRAARILHPDQGATAQQEELFRLLSLAKSVMEKAGRYV